MLRLLAVALGTGLALVSPQQNPVEFAARPSILLLLLCPPSCV
jgi:hypothetical protein